MVVAVGTDVLPLTGREDEHGAALREVLGGEELLREDGRTAPDRVEHALPDPHPLRVLAEHAHQRLERKLRGQLRLGRGAVAELGPPELMRMLELELVAGPEGIEPGRLQRACHAYD